MERNDGEVKNEFYMKPYVRKEILEQYKDEMLEIENEINKQLKEYPNFLGIDFCDVGAYGIQIRGHHKDISKYTFGSQPTIKYDFSNKEDVIRKFVSMWKHQDTPEEVMSFKRFIADGEKYGWD